jgi:hypothetical protein
MMDWYDDFQQLSRKGVSPTRSNAGIAYVIVPQDFDREEFINNCFRNSSVSIVNEYGERFDNVKVNTILFNYIVFPSSYKKLGSPIVWVKIPNYDIPVVVALLNRDEVINNIEGGFSFGRKSENSFVEIKGNSEDGEIIINVDTSSSKQGKIRVYLNSQNNDGLFDIKVKGNIDVEAVGEIKVKSTKKLSLNVSNLLKSQSETNIYYEYNKGFSYLDEFGNTIDIVDGKMQLKSKNILLSEGEEPIPLGNTLNENLNDLISIVDSLLNTLNTIGTADSTRVTPLSLSYAASFMTISTQLLAQTKTLKAKFEKHLSSISKTS